MLSHAALNIEISSHAMCVQLTQLLRSVYYSHWNYCPFYYLPLHVMEMRRSWKLRASSVKLDQNLHSVSRTVRSYLIKMSVI
jgi:hypothetical protein